MNRKKKLLLNTFAAIVQQVVTLICGFILPRLIITLWLSNEWTNIFTTQFYVLSMMEMGVGALCVHKPLAGHDHDQVRTAFLSLQRRFFNKIEQCCASTRLA